MTLATSTTYAASYYKKWPHPNAALTGSAEMRGTFSFATITLIKSSSSDLFEYSSLDLLCMSFAYVLFKVLSWCCGF